jgi:hypothetical protein
VTRFSLRASTIVLLLGASGPAVAQQPATWTVAPIVGVYLPTSDLVHDQLVPSPGPLEPERVTINQSTGLVLGIRANRTLSAKFTLELEFQYAFSDAEMAGLRREPADQVGDTLPARVITLGADVLYEVFRSPFTPFAIHLLGGLGLVSRGGEFFDQGGGVFESLEGGTDLALILGTGFRYGLSPRVGLRLDVRDYISSYTQSLPGGELDSQLQNDFWITAAAEISL